MVSFRSNGKLLITGEYAVLKNAKALAVPCKMGQSLTYLPSERAVLNWESFDSKKNAWFEAEFNVNTLKLVSSSDIEIGMRLRKLLATTKKMNPSFLSKGGDVKCHLEFERSWGLGTSSTLVANIALWANCNPYQLLENSFGGSGYDIGCAQAEGPITFIRNQYNPIIQTAELSYPFEANLFFVHLNKKRNSQDAVAAFDIDKLNQSNIDAISQFTDRIIASVDQNSFDYCLRAHETLIGSILNQAKVQDTYFSDFNGVVKSLGAWGGDFVLVSGDRHSPDYFRAKGYETIIPFREMIL